jgi:predicted RNase H-like nuclease (RuvC/YqgF family)
LERLLKKFLYLVGVPYRTAKEIQAEKEAAFEAKIKELEAKLEAEEERIRELEAKRAADNQEHHIENFGSHYVPGKTDNKKNYNEIFN